MNDNEIFGIITALIGFTMFVSFLYKMQKEDEKYFNHKHYNSTD